ncbi:FAD-binding oxidoreductase [Sinisalibacter lacisalsi]|uniref:D-2-hydroxyacid dehydrogenase n=1 Tax=Sinisalibacter lacisalsi TaxID=1526570 RepID=A0ABQ1QQF0_9RHOB|nr:FAD-binding oxidoreductase [Sinisalibacter lacisalsi]GGD37918.1 D-2-hydroxyacid dehydrogenase [Sinisalibacter lacisalsi]
MTFIEQALAILGDAQVLTGANATRYATDWTGKYTSAPLCVLRPGNAAEVSELLRAANATGTAIVPVSGNTGLSGGAFADGAALLSLERMNRIRAIRPEARVAVVEAGVVLADLHEAARAEGLAFPLTFGARGSAMIGGVLSTNAGGSNVLRYGNTRALCLGLEVVLPDGALMDLMSELHKDNSGYDLRDLFIGAEGTLGVITAAVLKLAPLPRATATAMLALPSLGDALGLLNRLQEATGGAVEAYEYMPRAHFERLAELRPELRPPFDAAHEANIMLEIGATAPRDATPGPDGTLPIAAYLESVLAEELEAGRLLDAVIAQNEAQRAEMWARREAAAEVAFSRKPFVANDIALPLDRLETFFARMAAALPRLDPGADDLSVAHLGDGNIHYTVYPSHDDPAHLDAVMQLVETQVRDLGGSFSAEHGIGLSKKPSMARHKNPVALVVMRRIKTALDPSGIMNPGKVLPD